MRILRTTFFCFLLILPLSGYGQQMRLFSSGEIQSAIDGLGTLGSVLYIGAHPDDENSALLAYLVNNRHVRTGYLSLTRGEGGQNLIGAEQGEVLGLIRSEELRAARRIDGAEQYFTRAIDFGYSKSSEEALRMWDREKVLGDIVRIIRTFRPDVIITRFSPEIGTHGHHTASAILAREAFEAAGDPARFADQLPHLSVWKPRRLLFNRSRSQDQPFDTSHAVRIDVGAYDRLLGRSYTEIAGLSRSMHKSQGFGSAQTRGSVVNFLMPTAGDPAKTDLFDGIDLSWNRVPGSERLGKLVAEVRSTFSAADPASCVPALVKLDREMSTSPADAWVGIKRASVREILRACLGLWIEALSSDSAVIPGGRVHFTVTVVNRSDVPVRLIAVGYRYGAADSVLNADLSNNRPASVNLPCFVPDDAPPSMPYWLAAPALHNCYTITNQSDIGMPENPPPIAAQVSLIIGGEPVSYEVPVEYRRIDPVDGEMRRPLQILPAVDVSVDERVVVFRDTLPKIIPVRVHGATARSRGTVRLEVPGGWTVDRQERTYFIGRSGEDVSIAFSVGKTTRSVNGSFRVVVKDSAGTEYTTGLRTVRYPHIVAQTYAPRAEGRLVPLDAILRKTTIGYIMGSGDEIPRALRQLGYAVLPITAEDLSRGDLGRCDAIVAGVRAYNTRPDLRTNHERLLEYVRNGGTYVVQYCVAQAGETDNVGPFPLTVGRDRVVDEDAPVTFLQPDHPLLNVPTKITQEDFRGWVQERGLSFASSWDSGYAAILGCNDPGESLQKGGLLFARYGKGCYVYTGYAFFRQLPAGVEGGYRLFVNLLEAGADVRPKDRRKK